MSTETSEEVDLDSTPMCEAQVVDACGGTATWISRAHCSSCLTCDPCRAGIVEVEELLLAEAPGGALICSLHKVPLPGGRIRWEHL